MPRDSQRYRKTYSYYRVQPRTDTLEIIADESLDWKHSVRAASTGDTSLTGSTPLVIDGVTISPDERILLKNQVASSENGIYYLEITGGNYTLVRDTDAVQGTLTCGASTYVEEGFTNSGKIYILSTINPISVGVTGLVWTEFSSGGGGSGGGSSYWLEDSLNKIYTTGSVGIGATVGPVGSDVYFFVSGSISGTGSEDRKSAFGGDVVMSGSLEISGDQVEITGSLRVTNGISGSLTNLQDGTSYLIAGNNVTIFTGSNGSVTISSTGGGGANTEYARLSYGATTAALAYTTTDVLWNSSPGEISTGISVTNGAAPITIANSGVYDVSFRGQINITAGVAPWQIWMFLQVDSGSGRVNVAESGAYEIYNNIYQRGSAGFRRLVSLNAGDILYVCFQVSHTGIFFDPVSPGIIPVSPAVELNIVSVTI